VAGRIEKRAVEKRICNNACIYANRTMIVSAELRFTEQEAAGAFLANGSDESFRALFEALYPKLVRYFVVRALELEAAEELAQDVLMTTYQRADSLRQKECFFGWLFRVAGNRHLQYLRQRKRKIETVGLTPNSVRELKRADNAIERESDFRRWMDLLEPMERQIMMLRYSEELGYQEIAAALSIPLGTVKWKIFSAKERLSRELRALSGKDLCSVIGQPKII
jgi:RNA polymerase sigma-70 factor (ECF subfamily)